MILVALGANLPSKFGAAPETLRAACRALEKKQIRVAAASRLYRSAPVPMSDQPWYYNAVVIVETGLDAAALMTALHDIEHEFGRVRGERNAARLLDLDLIAYDRLVERGAVTVPHPRLSDRAFVLLPLRDIAPDWVHPQTGARLADMIAALPPNQAITPAESLL